MSEVMRLDDPVRLVALRAWIDAGPDDPACIESVACRLLTCSEGPPPDGYTEGAVVVNRGDLRALLLRLPTGEGA